MLPIYLYFITPVIFALIAGLFIAAESPAGDRGSNGIRFGLVSLLVGGLASAIAFFFPNLMWWAIAVGLCSIIAMCATFFFSAAANKVKYALYAFVGTFIGLWILIALLTAIFLFATGGTVAPPPSQVPLTGIKILGGTSVLPGTYVWHASVQPVNASNPISYTWQVLPIGGQGTADATYTLSIPGIYTLSVTAQNGASLAQYSDTIVVTVLAPTATPTFTPTPPPTAAPSSTVPPPPPPGPVATRTPVPTSAPSPAIGTTPPSGWIEVDHAFTGGPRKTYNHDNDGDPSVVTLTWDNVQVLDSAGNVAQDLGQKSLRVTDDPQGERVSTTGGWRKFRWTGPSTPTQGQVDVLAQWWKGVVEAQPGAGTYTVSKQPVSSPAATPKHDAQPAEWAEVRDPRFAGDIQQFIPNYDLGGPNRIALAWFWAGSGPQAPTNGCTIFVMTTNGPVTFKGGLRTLGANATVTKELLAKVVTYWKSVLEAEPRGGCAHVGAYTVVYQNPNMAP